MNTLNFRRASPFDKEAVLALSAKIDHDYLAYVFDDWVREEPGGIYLAETGDGGLVAVVSLNFTGPREVFLRGMRVDPEFQGQGLGTEFARFQFAEAVRLGAEVVRLTTWEQNYRVHKMMERLGWRKAAEWLIVDELPVELCGGRHHQGGGGRPDGEGRGLGAAGVGWRWAIGDDLPLVTRILAAYPQGPLIPCAHDHWTVKGGAFDVAAEVAAGNVLLGPSPEAGPTEGLGGAAVAALIISTYRYSGDSGLIVRYLGGPPVAAASLAAFAASMAAAIGLSKVCASLPLSNAPPLLEGLGMEGPPSPSPPPSPAPAPAGDPAAAGGMGPVPGPGPGLPTDHLFRAFVYEKRPSAAGL